MWQRNILIVGVEGLRLDAGAPLIYSAFMDSPTLGKGISGPNALSANPAAFPQAARNEPRASRLATYTNNRPTLTPIWPWPGPDSGTMTWTWMSWAVLDTPTRVDAQVLGVVSERFVCGTRLVTARIHLS